MCYTVRMTAMQLKKLERLANESARYAEKALAKSREFDLYASILEYKMGKVKEYPSVAAMFRAAKRAR